MATEWIGFADALLHGLGLVREARVRRDDRADQALSAVYTATNETHRYIVALQRGLARDIDREHDLARLWHLASIPLRYFDADLAGRCMLKGNYWLDPQEWSVGDINGARIGLDRVFREAQHLLFLRP
jgi:hypothetical protein